MRSTFKGLMLAAGLALVGLSPAAAQPAATGGDAARAPVEAAAIGNKASVAQRAPDVAPAAPGSGSVDTPPLTKNPIIGQPTNRLMSIQPQVTKNGQRAMGFHNNILLPLIVVICLLVLALLVYVVIRYRQAANPIPSKTSHNTAIEVVWTLAPVLILVAIAVPSIGLLSAQFKPAPANAVTLKAIGNQWYWTYQYPDHGGFEITANMLKERNEVAAGERFRTDADGPRLLATDNRIVLPVGVPIRLITTANDVIHSWAIPAFWIKLDAVPGRLNETSFTIERPGVYYGQCSELCGARHAYMPITVEAVPPAQFAAWISAQGGSMPGANTSSSAATLQPGAVDPAGVASDAAVAENMMGPTDNATVVPATSQQGASNTDGAGDSRR